MPEDFSKLLSVKEVERQLDQDLPSIVISQFFKTREPLVKQFLQNLFQAEKMCTLCTQTYYYKTKKPTKILLQTTLLQPNTTSPDDCAQRTELGTR